MRSFTRPSTAIEGRGGSLRGLVQGEVGEDLPRPREYCPGGKSGLPRRRTLPPVHRSPRAPPRWPPGEVGVQPEVPEGGPELPDGGAEGALLGICEQCHCRAPQTLLGGTEAVEERGGADLEEDPQEGACSYARGRDERRPETRSGATPMVLMAMAAP